ncbi:MAG: hypothetical protein AB7I13_03675 [Vicinamibacterales bacterium]
MDGLHQAVDGVRDHPTTLWAVQRQGKEVACLARLVPYGIEIDIAHDGTVVLTRVFEHETEALAWAESKRTSRTAEGWTLVAVAPPDERPS